eukprot:TRINITY_DN3369_c0_g1_i1.p1 TRINITY_DN3369_c0_g1~~TRINITY_DN3369_c0_g1_i1.p1  ORF type:complete len:673 (-),score=98.27 TRINITY_DN3369_c0_g1_i1:418-2196(-)
MSPADLHRLLGFGYTHEQDDFADSEKPIGQYGNGFKSGSMRLGDDALVFTKHKGIQSIGFLSQSFLKALKLDEVVVPMASWDEDFKLINLEKEGVNTELSLKSLEIIENYSIFTDDEQVVEQFQQIGKSGTRIVIYNLKGYMTDQYEFDFTHPDDLRLLREEREADEQEPVDKYSLKRYLEVLYFQPKMKMYIQDKKVRPNRLLQSLYRVREHAYKPSIKSPKNMKYDSIMYFGFDKENGYSGIMYYHNNRLVKRYDRLTLMRHGDSRVIGVIDASFLTPTHNKQDFVQNGLSSSLEQALKDRLRMYWEQAQVEEKHGGPGKQLFMKSLEKKRGTGPFWIQCDKCMKWRKVNKPPYQFDDNWTCVRNLDKSYNLCMKPEENVDKYPKLLRKTSSKYTEESDSLEEETESMENNSESEEIIPTKKRGRQPDEPAKVVKTETKRRKVADTTPDTKTTKTSKTAKTAKTTKATKTAKTTKTPTKMSPVSKVSSPSSPSSSPTSSATACSSIQEQFESVHNSNENIISQHTLQRTNEILASKLAQLCNAMNPGGTYNSFSIEKWLEFDPVSFFKTTSSSMSTVTNSLNDNQIVLDW